MLDTWLRARLQPVVTVVASPLVARRVPATAVTGTGWLIGAGACIAAGCGSWYVALALWLVNRVLDGLDGAVARATRPSPRGGYLDLVADFTVYAGFVVGVAVARPEARLACVVLLAAYYASAAAFLTMSALTAGNGPTTLAGHDATRRSRRGDGRSVRFVGGLAEGAETVVAYVLFCLLPGQAAVIAWVFAAAVAITAVQRVWWGARALRSA